MILSLEKSFKKENDWLIVSFIVAFISNCFLFKTDKKASSSLTKLKLGLIRNLLNFKELLENEDYDAIYNEMQSVNKIKEILNGINIKK